MTTYLTPDFGSGVAFLDFCQLATADLWKMISACPGDIKRGGKRVTPSKNRGRTVADSISARLKARSDIPRPVHTRGT